MPKKKKHRQQTATNVTIKFKGLYPYDKRTGEDIEPHQMETKFTNRIANKIGDILASDDEIGFDQDNFDVYVKISR